MNMPQCENALSLHDSTVYVLVYDKAWCMIMNVHRAGDMLAGLVMPDWYTKSDWVTEGIYLR